MAESKLDPNLICVLVVNLLITVAWLTAACFLFYIHCYIPGGFCMVGPFFSFINYHGPGKRNN